MSTPGDLNFEWDALTQTASIVGRLALGGVLGPFVSSPGSSILWHDSSLNRLRASENGGAPVNVLTGGGGGTAIEFVQNAGVSLPQENKLNFDGTIIHASDNPGVATNVAITKADATHSGYLSAADWNTFNAGAGSGVSGSGASNQVTYWTGASTIAGNNNLQWVNASSFLNVQGHVSIGVGSTPVPEELLDIFQQFNSLSIPSFGINLETDFNPAVNATANGFGANFVVSSLGTHNFNTLSAVAGNAVHNGSGTVDTMNAATLEIDNQVGGTISNCIAAELLINNHAAGTLGQTKGAIIAINNSSTGHIVGTYGIDVNTVANSGGGTIGDNYGIFLRDQSGVATGDNYNLYSAGTNSKNKFEGEVFISAATTNRPGINIADSSGVNVTSPSDGDLWWNGTNLNFRAGGTTRDLLAGISTPVSIANGGTGQTTANAALNALLPSQGGNNGKFLQTNGTDASWVTTGGSGITPSLAQAYTNVNVSVPGAGNVTVPWNATDYDTDTYHDNVTNNTRLTIPFTGTYTVKVNPNMSGNATDNFTFNIFKNGNMASPVGRNSTFRLDSNPSGFNTGPSFSCDGQLTAGDYIELNIARTGGGSVNLNANSEFSINRIA